MCQIIEDFKISLIEDEKSPKTIESYVGDMKEIVVENSKDRVKIAYGSEKQVEVYSDKEVDRILFYIQNEDKASKRNKAIVMLLLYTDVRVSELCSIKIKGISAGKGKDKKSKQGNRELYGVFYFLAVQQIQV